MKHFKNIKNYNDLKAQYRSLVKANHPDNGGRKEAITEINIEFDALFTVWKARSAEAAEAAETAETVRSEFYTACGWEGSNHSWNRTLKEVAQIVRTYIKEKYPTYKFSVRTKYASMCEELHVDFLESPIEIYKTAEELTEDDIRKLVNKAMHNHYWTLDSYTYDEARKELKKIWCEHGAFYKCMNEVTKAVVDDVDAFVNSYNYEDINTMIDYCHVDFYYFGCVQNNGENIKVVPKTAKLKNSSAAPAKKTDEKKSAEEPEKISCDGQKKYTYAITKGEDTRDLSEIWIVRIKDSLNKQEYIKENNAMRERGGYYSKFKHGFIFRFDPTELLTA